MRRCLAAIAFVFTYAVAAKTGDAEKRSLYAPPFGVFTEEMKAELKITPEQWKSIQSLDAKRTKIWEKHAGTPRTSGSCNCRRKSPTRSTAPSKRRPWMICTRRMGIL